MSDREFEFYKIKSKECADYNQLMIAENNKKAAIEAQKEQQRKAVNSSIWILVVGLTFAAMIPFIL